MLVMKWEKRDNRDNRDKRVRWKKTDIRNGTNETIGATETKGWGCLLEMGRSGQSGQSRQSGQSSQMKKNNDRIVIIIINVIIINTIDIYGKGVGGVC